MISFWKICQKERKKSRIYLVRIDDFALGTAYNNLDKMDMALETGLIDGLLDKGLIVAEKLDHVNQEISQNFWEHLLKMDFICMVLISKT